MRQNVNPLVDLLFRGLPRPIATLDQSHCTPSGMLHPANRHKPLVFKLLPTVWEHDAVKAHGHYEPHNTLLVDDSPYKAARNHHHTALHPPEWSPLEVDPSRSDALGPGGNIRLVLEEIANAADLRDVVSRVNSTASPFWIRPSEDALYSQLRRQHGPVEMIPSEMPADYLHGRGR